MIQGAGRPRLQGEAALEIGVVGSFVEQHLDSDVAFQPLIAGAVNLTHPAGPQNRDDAVRAQLTAGVQSHGIIVEPAQPKCNVYHGVLAVGRTRSRPPGRLVLCWMRIPQCRSLFTGPNRCVINKGVLSRAWPRMPIESSKC